MRGMNSACVDLIYLDPPFNSGQQWSAPIGSEAAGAEFKDAWNLSDINIAEQGIIRKEHPALHAVIRAAGRAHSDSMRSYTIYMGIRLVEMRRILRPTGSIYLHCDDTAGAWLRTAMDAVFGKDCYRNTIKWCYTGPGNVKRWFPRKSDSILFYVKDAKQAAFNPVRIPHKSGIHNDGTVFGKTDGDAAEMREREREGKPIEDYWTDIGAGAHISRHERIGYPTQKPMALLERIVAASSNPGDLVMDPFCGCATACVAAEKLDRQWAGIDVSPLAYRLVQRRLAREVMVGSEDAPRLTGWNVTHREDIPQRTDLGAIPPYNSTQNKEGLFGRQRGYCNGCEVRFDYRNLAVDHIVPQSKGGGHHIDNLQLLCPACNSMKGRGSHAELIARLVDEGIRK